MRNYTFKFDTCGVGSVLWQCYFAAKTAYSIFHCGPVLNCSCLDWVGNFIGKETQFRSMWQRSLLHSMNFISDSKAFVQETSLPDFFLMKIVSHEIDQSADLAHLLVAFFFFTSRSRHSPAPHCCIQRARERESERTRERESERTRERTRERKSEGASERVSERTRERESERARERENEGAREPASEQKRDTLRLGEREREREKQKDTARKREREREREWGRDIDIDRDRQTDSQPDR